MLDLIAIDTFSDECRAAFLPAAQGGAPLIRSTRVPRSHASQLAVFVQELINEAGRRPEGIAVIAGPGSYTGLRIGVSTAKGLAWSMDVPLFAVSTLHFIAHAATDVPEGTHLVAVLQSRADEVFAASFSKSAGRIMRISPDAAMSVESARDLIGDGSQATSLVSVSSETAALCSGGRQSTHIVAPQVESVPELMGDHMDDFRVEDLNSFEPAYLKEFVARKASGSIFDRLPF